MTYPEKEDLYQQLGWYQKRLKPYLERTPIGFWAEHPEKYQWARMTEDWLIKAIQAQER